MEALLSKIRSNPYLAGLAGMIIVGAGIFLFTGGKNVSPYEVSVVERGELRQEVSVTGKVTSAESVDLSFSATGRIGRVNASVGAVVGRGETLLSLENADVAAQLAQAQATLGGERAKLNELLRGTRTEELQVTKTKAAAARHILMSAIEDAYTKADDAIRNKSDRLFDNPRSSNPILLSSLLIDAAVKSGLNFERVQMESLLLAWSASVAGLTEESDLSAVFVVARENLKTARLFLEALASALSGVTPSSTLTQATIDSWKTDNSAARAEVGTAGANLIGAQADLSVAESELVLKEAGTSLEELDAQQASVEEAQAAVKNYEAQLAKTVMRAPFDAIVVRQDGKVGQAVSANAALVSLMSSGGFYIETFVPEADIAKLELGNPASVTLDAYGDTAFGAKVGSIDPAETVIEGVSTYKVKLQFTEVPEAVKSGMTANVDILAHKRDDVVAIPARAIYARDGKQFLKILRGSLAEEREVSTGLQGSDGRVEITSGLQAGESVILFTK